MIIDKSGLMEISGSLSVEGAKWIQENLYAYSEIIIKTRKGRLSNSKIDMVMILYMKVS